MSIRFSVRSCAALALVLTGTVASAQSTPDPVNPLEISEALDTNFSDGHRYTISAPSGTWVGLGCRATFDIETIRSYFPQDQAGIDAFLTFIFRSDMVGLIPNNEPLPAGTIAGQGPFAGGYYPAVQWSTEDAFLHVLGRLYYAGYTGVWPILPSCDAAIPVPIDPETLADVLMLAFTYPLDGVNVDRNAKYLLQMAKPPASDLTSAEGTLVWQGFDYQTWNTPYTPEPYLTYWNNVMASQSEIAGGGSGTMTNYDVVSNEKWASQALKAAMNRDDAVKYLFQELRDAAIAAYNGQVPSAWAIDKLPVCVKVLPVGVEDQKAIADYRLANANAYPSIPNSTATPGIPNAQPGSSGPPPRIRFGNPYSVCVTLREFMFATGTRNGTSFDPHATAGKLVFSAAGNGFKPISTVFRANGVVYTIECMPGELPGTFVGDLPPTVTVGTSVRVLSLATGVSFIAGTNGAALFTVVAQ